MSPSLKRILKALSSLNFLINLAKSVKRTKAWLYKVFSFLISKVIKEEDYLRQSERSNI